MEQPKEVIVVNVKMSFSDMVVFLIRWALAAIPALLILLFFGAIASGIFVGMGSK